MTDLRQRLQDVLGAGYRIERELGGGGMSQVFLAHDTVLDRRVVVKVLPPELAAAISGERFHREILLAAQLQHPHIVPVLTAGASDGLDYYTMPLVDGESLRTRLTRLGALPVIDAVRILHDVVDALHYAHARGIVHRDIKPENVLMTGQHALVTDFGVAKAVSAGSRGGPDTGAGIAIGTPAYMAPEQAAADPDTDHRADVYAVGVLAYELLAGRAPFAGRSPHETLAAHLSEDPQPLDQVRADVPPALAALIMHCLAKSPARRPQTAAAIRDELESLATPSGFTPLRRPPRLRPRRWAIAAALFVLVALLGVAALQWWPKPAPLDTRLIAVVPFRVAGASPALGYLREGMLDLLATKLTGVGGPRSTDPRSLLSAWNRAVASPDADLPREEAVALARRLGAAHLLLGEVVGTPERLVLQAALVTVRDGATQARTSVEGPSDSLPALVDRLAAQLLSLGAGEEAQRLASLTSTSLPALRAYLEGQGLYRSARFPEAARRFQEALEHDSTFALSALGLAKASAWYGDPAAGTRGLELAWRSRERLVPRDRAHLEAIAGPNYPAPSSQAELIAARERLVALAPDRAEAWFELGDGLFHSGARIGVPDPHERAAAAFRRAIDLDSAFSPAIEHLVLVEARGGDTAAVRHLSDLYLSLDSGSASADGIRWRRAVALGDSAAARAIVARADELSPASAHTIETIGMLDGIDIDGAQRVMASHLRRATTPPEQYMVHVIAHDMAMNLGHPSAGLELTEAIATLAPLADQELRERVKDALFWDGDSAAAVGAAATLERRLAGRRPADRSETASRRASLCITSLWHAVHGDTARARAGTVELLEPREPASAGGARADATCASVVEAMLADRGRSPEAAAARERLDSLLRTGPGGIAEPIGNLVVSGLHESAGDLPRALAAVRRREYFLGRPLFLSTFLREEGRLAAATGDREGAIRAYRHYLALRADPEPPLRGEAERIREALERLERESAGQ